MGIDENLIKSTIRFGIGRFNSLEEVEVVVDAVVEAVSDLRQLSWATKHT
jgi:cysteine desulfurase